MDEGLVWYAAYGSNVDRRRFLTYLTGGPVPGTDDTQEGSRDRSPPLGDEPFRFSRPIRFANHSSRWNGATAVLDHDVAEEGALGRRYLITETQFADLVAQENRRPTADLPLGELVPDQVLPFSDRTYDGLLLLAREAGAPTVTFTSPTEPTELMTAAPSAAYLGTMARGISQSHDVSAGDVARRLHRAPGVAPTWSIEAIEALL